MNRKPLSFTWLLVFVFLISFLVAPPAPVMATQDLSQFSVWQTKTTDNPLKVWTIKFNTVLAASTVTTGNIYVLDNNDSRVAISLQLSADGSSVAVTPASAYAQGQEYRLFITNGLTDRGGRVLSPQVIVPFVVVGNSQGIALAKLEYTSLLTNVTVVTGSDVYSVRINGQAAHYLGDGVYSLGLTGLQPGQSISIQALDFSGKVVDTTNKVVGN